MCSNYEEKRIAIMPKTHYIKLRNHRRHLYKVALESICGKSTLDYDLKFVARGRIATCISCKAIEQKENLKPMVEIK